MSEFMAYDPNFAAGLSVAVADVNGDGQLEIVTGPDEGGGPHVRVFSLAGVELAGFMAYDSTMLGGVRVSAGPGFIVTAPAAGGPHVKVFRWDDIRPK